MQPSVRKLCREVMVNIHDCDGAANYLDASLLSFQNLKQQEKTDIAKSIKEYRDEKGWPNRLRVWAIGNAYFTVLGEKNFRQVVSEMESYLENLRKEMQPKTQDMASTEEKPPRL